MTTSSPPRESAIVAPNTGWAGHMGAGETLRLTAMTIIDFAAFNAADPTERFDQARTKVYNMNIFLTAGHKVMSKLNNHMMTMTEDGFAGLGTHDLPVSYTHLRAHET